MINFTISNICLYCGKLQQMKKAISITTAIFIIIFVTLSKSNAQQQGDLVTYGKYDFVPGDKIVFEDDFSGETVGEFPSKWKLISGSAENVNVGEYPAIGITKSNAKVAPLMKTENFLPKIFTLEFDIYIYVEGNEAYKVYFGTGGEMNIQRHKITFGSFGGDLNPRPEKGWHHIAIAVNDKKMKVYFNESRILNIPEISKPLPNFSISSLSFGAAKGKPSAIKSVRLAEGGMPLYNRIMTDGKYITRGILFDVNKATLKPQSMGVINEMVTLMKEHADMKFSIEGHTDSDGDENPNKKLSEERAIAVKKQMASMGIDESRLSCKGYGEAKPLAENSSPEGKANNRRVEFVKL